MAWSAAVRTGWRLRCRNAAKRSGLHAAPGSRIPVVYVTSRPLPLIAQSVAGFESRRALHQGHVR